MKKLFSTAFLLALLAFGALLYAQDSKSNSLSFKLPIRLLVAIENDQVRSEIDRIDSIGVFDPEVAFTYSSADLVVYALDDWRSAGQLADAAYIPSVISQVEKSPQNSVTSLIQVRLDDGRPLAILFIKTMNINATNECLARIILASVRDFVPSVKGELSEFQPSSC